MLTKEQFELGSKGKQHQMKLLSQQGQMNRGHLGDYWK